MFMVQDMETTIETTIGTQMKRLSYRWITEIVDEIVIHSARSNGFGIIAMICGGQR